MTAAPEPGPRTGRIADRTRHRHAAIRQLLDSGRSVQAVAAGLGLARNTVRRFARAASAGELLVHDGTGRRPGMLDEYEPCLRERRNAGCTGAAALWREIRARGYPGGYSRVRDYLARFRAAGPMPAPPPAPPKTREATGWIMTRPGSLTRHDQQRLDAILAASPDLAVLTGHVRGFAALMTERRGRDLEQWMTAAHAGGEPGLRSLVTGLRAGHDAARCTYPSGPGICLISPLGLLSARRDHGGVGILGSLPLTVSAQRRSMAGWDQPGAR